MVIARFSHVIFIFACSLSIGLGLKCFQCNSAETSKCQSLDSNDTSSPFYKNCTTEYIGQEGQVPFCRKLFTRVMRLDNSERIFRGCGWMQRNNSKKADYCKKSNTDFLERTSCMCFSDACNASEITRASPVILSIVPIILILIFHLYYPKS